VDYHRELVDAIADRFGLTFTQCQRIPAHFTLKYHFTTSEIERVEELLEEFASSHAPAPLEVGGFGHFGEDVVFVDVRLSDSAKRTLIALISVLKTLPWMPWSAHDAEHLHPHMTVAEFCRPKFPEVWEFVKVHERRFTTALDNATIRRQVGEADGVDLWTIHKSFPLRA
jgi:2'-5' RNA ligase